MLLVKTLFITRICQNCFSIIINDKQWLIMNKLVNDQYIMYCCVVKLQAGLCSKAQTGVLKQEF